MSSIFRIIIIKDSTLILTLDNELKNDLCLVCMLICAVDGKISNKEKKWLRQLID